MTKYLLLLLLFSCAHQNFKEKIVVAHRGASGHLPEHTLAGVVLAHSHGVDFVEPDLVLTRDDHPIVLHDIYLEKTTNVSEVFPKKARKDGRWYAVDFTLEEIKKLRVFERFNPKTKKAFYPKRFPVGKSSFRVPSLREYIELVQGLNKTLDKKVGLYPEIKHPQFHLKEGKDITLIVMDILNEYQVEKIFVQCFDPKTLKRIRKMNKTIPLIQLIGENAWFNNSVDYSKMRTEKGLQEISTYANGVGPWLKHIFEEKNGSSTVTRLISWAHKNNLKVHPYTVRKDQLPGYVKDLSGLVEKLFKEAKADGVFTDHGLEVKEILKSL
ncbi:MAG: glycerophosphodiester phosphodiesterase [Bdellovibrionota bacterium]|nr:glycerophosphodiester phosphodiesterase [Bdellovibrionota bacterium]